MSGQYPRGSQWRKWDLHVHSPLSILNNQYQKLPNGEPDWEAFISKLESPGDIAVIGITDYFSIAGYRKVIEFREQGRLGDIHRILPNIELRLDTFVVKDKSRDINFHVIFSDELNPHVIQKEFVEALKVMSLDEIYDKKY